MKIVVLGATGMLGHKVTQVLAGAGHEVTVTARNAQSSPLGDLPGPFSVRAVEDLGRAAEIRELVASIAPDVVINCVGVIKQVANDVSGAVQLARLNTLLPHTLAEACVESGARLVHFSTDCVYSGRDGGYVEADLPDPVDLYGRTKLAGEPDRPGVLTIRTSIIGRELRGHHSLVEWLLSQDGGVGGFRRAVFSGLPTIAVANLLRDVVLDRDDLSGVWHVSAAPIDKFTLLDLIAERMGHSVAIHPSDTVVIDRSLDSSAFRSATGWAPPDWDVLVDEMASDAQDVSFLYR